MGVDHTLWRSGAPARKKDGRHLVFLGLGHLVWDRVLACLSDLCNGRSSRQKTGAGHDLDSYGPSSPSEHNTRGMSLWYADKGTGFCFSNTPAQVLDPYPRIDHHGHSARLEQGKGQRKKLQTRTHHENCPHSSSDADSFKAAGQSITLLVQLRKRKMCITHAPIPVTPVWKHHSQGIGPALCHGRQAGSNVGKSCLVHGGYSFVGKHGAWSNDHLSSVIYHLALYKDQQPVTSNQQLLFNHTVSVKEIDN